MWDSSSLTFNEEHEWHFQENARAWPKRSILRLKRLNVSA
jgi:hypothetical protein